MDDSGVDEMIAADDESLMTTTALVAVGVLVVVLVLVMLRRTMATGTHEASHTRLVLVSIHIYMWARSRMLPKTLEKRVEAAKPCQQGGGTPRRSRARLHDQGSNLPVWAIFALNL